MGAPRLDGRCAALRHGAGRRRAAVVLPEGKERDGAARAEGGSEGGCGSDICGSAGAAVSVPDTPKALRGLQRRGGVLRESPGRTHQRAPLRSQLCPADGHSASPRAGVVLGPALSPGRDLRLSPVLGSWPRTW